MEILVLSSGSIGEHNLGIKNIFLSFPLKNCKQTEINRYQQDISEHLFQGRTLIWKSISNLNAFEALDDDEIISI